MNWLSRGWRVLVNAAALAATFLQRTLGMDTMTNDDVGGSSKSFDMQISVSGFNEDDGTKLGNVIAEIIKKVCAAGIDLSALEGVTVTPNYREMLSAFDTGLPTRPTPTAEKFANGQAMAVTCKRGDDFKSHLFFDADILSPLLFGTEPERALATNVLAHELAHVYDSGRLAKELANQPFPNDLTGWLFLMTNATWSEYFACLVTAETDPSLDDYITTFLNALGQYPEAIREQIAAYRRHSDTQRLMDFVQGRVSLLFKFAGYVLGNLDGTGRQLAQTHPDAWQSIQDAGFSEAWIGIASALQRMESGRPWQNISIYDELGRAALGYLNSLGMFPRNDGDRIYVAIPQPTPGLMIHPPTNSGLTNS
ncbi:hypothetical protein FDV58_24855 [Bradyrhizobium elkanii]|uniref:Peptidase M48 domain-containing protein n=1 Tax=Bradyrhizobium elkanii TaxID=29448 RepID=A0A4U6RV46_BRAEL|nr:hypothetical protein [Bradyrhizobium elkanii]TKV78934.1 hypothetical protein FDV58_24855 [Bradyrhizobium elkanii]